MTSLLVSITSVYLLPVAARWIFLKYQLCYPSHLSSPQGLLIASRFFSLWIKVLDSLTPPTSQLFPQGFSPSSLCLPSLLAFPDIPGLCVCVCVFKCIVEGLEGDMPDFMGKGPEIEFIERIKGNFHFLPSILLYYFELFTSIHFLT